MSTCIKEYNNLLRMNSFLAGIAAGEKKWNKETFSSVSLNALPDNSYCGRQSLHLVVDSGREVNETSEMNNRLTKSVTILCPGGTYGYIRLKLCSDYSIASPSFFSTIYTSKSDNIQREQF